MDRYPVNSSNVLSVGYDTTTSTMEVEFKNGDIYQYYEVPARIYQNLINAKSVGKYLDQNVKKRGYRYKKI